MPQQIINLGAAPNDGTGDDLRTVGQKLNEMFAELYAAVDTIETHEVVETETDYVAIEPKNPKKVYLVKGS